MCIYTIIVQWVRMHNNRIETGDKIELCVNYNEILLWILKMFLIKWFPYYEGHTVVNVAASAIVLQ